MSFRANIQRLKTGHFQLDFILPYSQKRKRYRYKSYEEALEAQKVAELRFNPMRRKEYADHTIRQLMEMHIEDCPDSKVDNRLVTKAEFLAEFGDWKLSKVNQVELERWLKAIAEKRQLSYKTILQWALNLNSFFDYLVAQDILAVSPLRLIRHPSQSSIPVVRPRVILTQEEIREILEIARIVSRHYFYPFFLLAVHTGARKGELLGLLWADVDFNRKAIRFRKTKNGSDREIKMPDPVMEYLRSAPQRSPYVLTCEEGLPIGLSQLNWRLSVFRREFSNGKNWGIHSFRHSFAHQFLKKGGQMYSLQAILGHRNILLTVNLYGQIQAAEIENPSPYDF